MHSGRLYIDDEPKIISGRTQLLQPSNLSRHRHACRVARGVSMPTRMPTMFIELPCTFIDSALPTKAEWESSLLLPDDERSQLEQSAMADNSHHTDSPQSVLVDGVSPNTMRRMEDEADDQDEYYQIISLLRAQQAYEQAAFNSQSGRQPSDSRRRIVVADTLKADDDTLSAADSPKGLSFRTRRFMEAIAKLRLDECLEECEPTPESFQKRFRRRTRESRDGDPTVPQSVL